MQPNPYYHSTPTASNWRHLRLIIDEHILFIRQWLAADPATIHPSNLERLRWRLFWYPRALRALHEVEAQGVERDVC